MSRDRLGVFGKGVGVLVTTELPDALLLLSDSFIQEESAVASLSHMGKRTMF